jgi:hypothetical protein
MAPGETCPSYVGQIGRADSMTCCVTVLLFSVSLLWQISSPICEGPHLGPDSRGNHLKTTDGLWCGKTDTMTQWWLSTVRWEVMGQVSLSTCSWCFSPISSFSKQTIRYNEIQERKKRINCRCFTYRWPCRANHLDTWTLDSRPYMDNLELLPEIHAIRNGSLLCYLAFPTNSSYF